MKLEDLVASLIKQHRKRWGVFHGHLYLTPKQTQFYLSLYGKRVEELKSTDMFTDGKSRLMGYCVPNGVVYEIYRYGKKLSYLKDIGRKSVAVLKTHNGVKTRVFIKSVGFSIVSFLK